MHRGNKAPAITQGSSTIDQPKRKRTSPKAARQQQKINWKGQSQFKKYQRA